MTLPRGQASTRPPSPGSGSVRQPQSKRSIPMGKLSAPGMRMKIEASEPPCSITVTLRPASAGRWAIAQPAEPAPTTM